MKHIAPLAMWLLVTAGLASASAISFYLSLDAFAVTFGVIALFAGVMASDELHIYRRTRKREPKVEPLTRIPGYPEQPKRPIR